MLDAYFLHLLILISIYTILALSLQLSIGFSGLLNMGHITFWGIGAYAYSILAINNLPSILCFFYASVISALFGFLLAIPSKKIKGDYFTLMSLGFNFVIYAIFQNWSGLTGGSLGLPGIPRPIIFDLDFSNNSIFLLLVIIIALFSYFFIYRISNSPFGKALEATRDDELAAKSLGKNTYKLKIIVLTTSAFFAGLAGCLFASYISFIDPSSFTFTNLIPILLIVIIGGITSLHGTVLSTIIIILLPELFRFTSLPSEMIGPMRQIFYALALILIIYFKPRGFCGKIELE